MPTAMKTFSNLLKSTLCVGSFIHAVQGQSSNWTVGQVVHTSSGSVTGHSASVNTDVSEYLGIPFAVPPVGELRWTAPQVYNGTAAINGTNYGFSCPSGPQAQISVHTILEANVTNAGIAILTSLGQYGDNFSEDCLTLNIWTKPQIGDSKKAVLVWIYGGAFTSGSSDSSAYNGQHIVEQEDVILVSFNYRLNVFGFPGTPNATQNLGLLDQRLAVEWVRDNIAAFGGDPSRITLFGQSAGSASVDYFTFAYADDPIAHSFIEESGSALGPAPGLGPITADTASGLWFNLTATLNCGNSTSNAASVLVCMKSKSFHDILEAAAAGAAGSITGSSFGPTIDEKVTFSDYPSRAAAGNFAKLPLLLGTADYEAGIFRLLDAFQNISEPDAYWDSFDDIVFTCPSAARANASISAQVPTWRYRWFGAFPNTELTSVPFSGAWHSSELAVLFNNTPTTPSDTEAEIAIGSYFRGAWATFAKNPTTGLTTYQDGWPMYSPTEHTLVQLAYNNQTGNNLAMGNAFDGTCTQVVANTVSNSTSNSTSQSSTSLGSSASPTPSSTSGTFGATPSSGGLGSSNILSLKTLVLIVAVVMGLSI